MNVSLSKYFPKGTEYFYSFPEGQDSDFFSDDPPWKEELFATRPLVCAGDGMKVIIFGSSLKNKAWNILYNEVGQPKVKDEHILKIPDSVDITIEGAERTKLIKEALK